MPPSLSRPEVPLPVGVGLRSLTMHSDPRGSFSEIFRAEWGVGVAPLQWNFVRSEPGVLRGVHVHLRHSDYLIIAQGRASVGLKDLRRGSPTEGLPALLSLSGAELQAVTIPPGVAHGFYFHEPSLHIYAVSHYWDDADELGCHWADPALEIPWPMDEVSLSDRDDHLPPLAELHARIPPFQAG